MTTAAKRQTQETIVGAVVVAALAVFLVYAFATGKSARAGYVLNARYEQVDGLSIGSPVLLAGVKVGEVTAMRLDPPTRKPIVGLLLDRNVKLPKDTAAMVMSDGVLGGKFVKLVPGADDEFLKAGEQFQYVQDALIVEELLDMIVRRAEARRAGTPQ